MSNNLPAPFIKSIDERLGSESKAFFEALQTEPVVSIRFNPYKLSEKPKGRQVPWSKYGFLLDQRPQFTLDPLFHGGAYYVQEASSMFIEHLVREAFDSQTEGLKILDLCAAPGGKTTLLSTLVGLEGLVVANEVIRQRAQVLADNVRKWGLGNVAVTHNDAEHFAGFEHVFDVIAVDAPCSGEGMFRKNPDARMEWSEGNVALCAARQKRILSDIWGSLKPGGILIYSTCTFNSAENEDNVAWLFENYNCEPVDIYVDPSWGIVKGEVDGVNTFRFYPHRVQGEGFFATIIRKGEAKIKTKTPKPRKEIFSDLPKQSRVAVGEWVNQPEFMRFQRIGENIYGYYNSVFPAIKQLAESMTVIYSGVQMGQLFGSSLRPEHPLALFHDLSRDAAPDAELELADALEYLRKHDIDPQALEEGINAVCYGGLPIGWIKRIGLRANNMYPKEWRIVNL